MRKNPKHREIEKRDWEGHDFSRAAKRRKDSGFSR
jgi:hypothetical protein